MQPRQLLLAIAALVAVGCGSDNATGTSGLSGTASFTFSGAASGSFSATGAVPFSGDTESSPWAAGLRDDSEGVTVVFASMPRPGSMTHSLLIQVPLTTAGTATIDDACQADNCPAVIVILNVDNATDEAEFLCGLTSGSVTITSATSSRVQGTFSGTGDCITDGGSESFTVTNGSFNVALISNFALLRSP